MACKWFQSAIKKIARKKEFSENNFTYCKAKVIEALEH
jgi:hypothetical protein